MVDAAFGNEKGMLGGLKIRNVQSSEARDLAVNGLFFAIGHEPASKFLAGQVPRDPACPPQCLQCFSPPERTDAGQLPKAQASRCTYGLHVSLESLRSG